MHITDLNGHQIEVINLEEAIRITNQHKGYRHKDKSFSAFDRRQCAYWKDMYGKLLALKQQLSKQKINNNEHKFF